MIPIPPSLFFPAICKNQENCLKREAELHSSGQFQQITSPVSWKWIHQAPAPRALSSEQIHLQEPRKQGSCKENSLEN